MKPLKETKIGKFLLSKGLDHLLKGIADIVPGIRTLDKLKSSVLGAMEVSEADKKQFMEYYKISLEELDKELANTLNARSRERDFVKATGHIDWFMTAFGIVIVICFVFTVVISATDAVPADMREIFIESRAAVRDIVLAIAAYYWGSSAGSRMKDVRAGRSGRW